MAQLLTTIRADILIVSELIKEMMRFHRAGFEPSRLTYELE
jgi:hypothetical protein